ncbi:hypothetical protein THPR109532_18695 [Thalassospira profundimaris]|nr:hypothetical protein TH2_04833 [Thalassospira profundimaris WP0211]
MPGPAVTGERTATCYPDVVKVRKIIISGRAGKIRNRFSYPLMMNHQQGRALAILRWRKAQNRLL